jgi:hypothetical protein
MSISFFYPGNKKQASPTSSAIPDSCHCGGDGGSRGVAVAVLAQCITGDKDVFVKQHLNNWSFILDSWRRDDAPFRSG